MIPGIGFVFDLADAALCYYENDTVGMALSLASAIPFSGLMVGAGKLGRQTLKFGGYLSDVIRSSGKMARFADKTADIAKSARTLLRSGIPEKFAAFTLKGEKAAKILQKGGDALKDVGRVMRHQGEKIYTSVKTLVERFKGSSANYRSIFANQKNNLGKLFYSIKNKAGGKVYVSVGEIAQSDFLDLANKAEGKVNIISGVHGTPSGFTIKELKFLKEDLEKFTRIDLGYIIIII